MFEAPPAGVDDAAFDTFYARHVEEILTVAGFEAGRRYAVHSTDDAAFFPYPHLAIYRISGDPAAAIDRLIKTSETDQITLPDWFWSTPFLAWTTAPLRSGAPDVVAAPALQLSLSLEELAEPRGEQYELTERDADERLPSYRWADIVADGESKAGRRAPVSGVLDLECSAIGPKVTG